MSYSVLHVVLLAGAVIAGLLGSVVGLASAHLHTPHDISDNTISTTVEPATDIDLPIWYVALVLIVGPLLSLSIFYRSHGILSYLFLYLVFFSLLAISLMDLEWQMIGLDLFVPLAIGSIGWVMLHRMSLWLLPVAIIFTGWMLVIYLIGHRKSHGDLLLATLVGLFAGAGLVTYHSTLVVITRLMLGAFLGIVALLAYSLLKPRNDSENKKTWKQWNKQTTPLAPLFLVAAMSVTFVR